MRDFHCSYRPYNKQIKDNKEYFKFYYRWDGGWGWGGEGRSWALLGLGLRIKGLYLIHRLFARQMQGNSMSSNILRNSYGYQGTETPQMRSPNHKTFPMGTNQYHANHVEPIPSSIKQLESKLEGVQGLVKKKFSTLEAPFQPQVSRVQAFDNRFKTQSSFIPQEQQLSEHLLRGSCQNVMKKFDYNNLRNTTHFNPLNKMTTHNELRRSPGAEDPNAYKNTMINRTITQEPSNVFLKPLEKKLLENKHSFLANNQSRSPNSEKLEDKTLAASKTPIKYKSFFDKSPKGSFKGSPDPEEKRIFKTLTEIVENKSKERNSPQTSSSGRRSQIINGFQLGPSVGKGKFGEVFLARHRQTGFIAAIKKIEKQKVREFKMVEQFSKEIRLHSCLDHPNIVRFFGVFEEGGDVFLVMEYLNGGTLFDLLNEVSCLGVREAAEYLKDVIEALSYMHEKSIAHRDIKPENIVISSEGVAKLCDFGWSALIQTSRKTYCGTFDYAPPEILERKNYDASVDIWCIGVLAFELLTGRVPFEGEKRNVIMEKILNVDKNRIDYPAEVPPEAREFIEALVQKDPGLRPKCSELLQFRLFSLHLGKGRGKRAQ